MEGTSGDRFPSPSLISPSRGDPRRRLLDAMVRTVAGRGYDRTTTARVLAEAHMPQELFAEHFRDKHDCFLQALDELIGGAEQGALDWFAAEHIPWPERVRGALASLLQALAGNPDAARVVFVEMLAVGPAAHERQRRAHGLFASLIEQGRAHAPHPDALAPQTSEAIVGGVLSILHRRVLQGEVEQLPTLLADLTYFALLPYVDREEAMVVAELRPAA